MSCPFYKFESSLFGGDYYCVKQEKVVDSDTYYKYCRNYDYDDCPIYKHQSSSSGCFLTSACVSAKGLPDDCYELQALRNYRDHWLAKTEGGLAAISHYYIVAPKIVAAIDKLAERHEIYEMIYNKMIKPCVEFIEQKKYQDAFELYRGMTLQLADEYC